MAPRNRQLPEGLNALGRSDATIWVTEHGYAADPRFQVDPSYRGTDLPSGEQAQAAYYRASLPAMVAAGADRVFVTLRDEAAEETPGRRAALEHGGTGDVRPYEQPLRNGPAGDVCLPRPLEPDAA